MVRPHRVAQNRNTVIGRTRSLNIYKTAHSPQRDAAHVRHLHDEAHKANFLISYQSENRSRKPHWRYEFAIRCNDTELGFESKHDEFVERAARCMVQLQAPSYDKQKQRLIGRMESICIDKLRNERQRLVHCDCAIACITGATLMAIVIVLPAAIS